LQAHATATPIDEAYESGIWYISLTFVTASGTPVFCDKWQMAISEIIGNAGDHEGYYYLCDVVTNLDALLTIN